PQGRVVRARVTDIATHGKLDLNPGSAKVLFPNGASSAAINQGHVGVAYRPVPSDFSGQLASDIGSSPLAAGPIDPQAAAAISARQQSIVSDEEGASDATDTGESDEGESPEITAARQTRPLSLDVGGLIKSPVVSDN